MASQWLDTGAHYGWDRCASSGLSPTTFTTQQRDSICCCNGIPRVASRCGKRQIENTYAQHLLGGADILLETIKERNDGSSRGFLDLSLVEGLYTTLEFSLLGRHCRIACGANVVVLLDIGVVGGEGGAS